MMRNVIAQMGTLDIWMSSFRGSISLIFTYKNDTFTVEGVIADLRHYIPTLACRSRCFPRKLENLQAVLAVFVRAYNRFGLQKHLFRSKYPGSSVPFSVFDFL